MYDCHIMPVNYRTVCEWDNFKDSITGLTTVFCCGVNMAIYLYGAMGIVGLRRR